MDSVQTVSAPVAADPVMDTGIDGFMQDVIEASHEVPVVVDFWAPWCGPCKQLGPLLEKHVRAQKGKVRMAKVNIDQNQQLAASMQVQSIPAVYIFYGGRPIDGFVGAVPESQIKAMMEKLATVSGGEPGGADIASLLQQAHEFALQGKHDHAAALYMEILNIEPEHAGAYIGLIRAAAAEGVDDRVRQLVAQAPEQARAAKEWPGIEKMLALADAATQAGSLDALKAKVDADGKNHQARYEYANALYAAGAKADAVEQLLQLVKADRKWNDEAARKQLVTIFEALGHADPLTVDARKRLSTLLFS